MWVQWNPGRKEFQGQARIQAEDDETVGGGQEQAAASSFQKGVVSSLQSQAEWRLGNLWL